jgi:mannose/fructose-specific phosphotransferase system component IIA
LNGEAAIVFTDLFGGSVNQKVLLESVGKEVQIIAGFNLSLVLEVILNKDQLTEERLKQLITSAREAMQVVAPLPNKEVSEEEFFA